MVGTGPTHHLRILNHGRLAIWVPLAPQWSTYGGHHRDVTQHHDGTQSTHKCGSKLLPFSRKHFAKMEEHHV